MSSRLACAATAIVAACLSAAVVSAAPVRIPSGTCPAGALPIARADLPRAKAAALRFVKGPWAKVNPGIDVRGASGRATLAPRTVRGGYAKIKCGRAVWRRTAVVFVLLPRMAPSASLSSPVFYVARTSRGWRVWFQIH